MRFWVGGWGAAQGGESEGISLITAGEADSPLAGGTLADRGVAARVESPSWLAAHPSRDVVYAALEADGRVAAFARRGDRLMPLGDAAEAGAAVCHLAVAPSGRFLVASCWGDGRVVRLPIRPDGGLGEPSLAERAIDPYGPAEGAPAPVEALDGDGVVDAAGLLRGGMSTSDIVASLVGEADRALPADWEGALDLRTLADGGADPRSIAAALAGSAPSSGLADLLAAIRQGPSDPFDDPAVRGILHAVQADAREGTAAGKPAEERVSRAHAAAFLPDGRIATTDLGFDLVRFWRVSAAVLVPDHEVVLPFGTGPRHLLLHPSGHLYVLTEFSGEVFVLAEGADRRWALLRGLPASPQELAGDTGAEIARSRDGHTIYAGLRGSDTIAVLRVRGEGDRLEPAALVDSGVTTPRHHLPGRDALLVAGQGSNEVVTLPLDQRTGIPTRVVRRLPLGSPTHLLPTR